MEIKELIKELYNENNKIAYDKLKKLEKLSEDSDNVYLYFEEFILMLNNKNSYIRTRGIRLIAKNTQWDKENKINKNITKILEQTEDEKPINSRQCIKSLKEILKYKKELKPIIKEKLVNLNYSKYNESMQKLIKKDVKDILKNI